VAAERGVTFCLPSSALTFVVQIWVTLLTSTHMLGVCLVLGGRGAQAAEMVAAVGGGGGGGGAYGLFCRVFFQSVIIACMQTTSAADLSHDHVCTADLTRCAALVLLLYRIAVLRTAWAPPGPGRAVVRTTGEAMHWPMG
jgi:hypothetical protein